jgi:hypothetical protein
MRTWRFLQYVSPQGRAAIDDWRKALAVGPPRADLDVFLKTMAKLREWAPPDIDTLKGSRYQGLLELRWKSGRKPHRILGYQSADREYTMLVGCTHDGKKYDPPDAFETAVRRRKQIESGEAQAREYQLITDEPPEEQGIP